MVHRPPHKIVNHEEFASHRRLFVSLVFTQQINCYLARDRNRHFFEVTILVRPQNRSVNSSRIIFSVYRTSDVPVYHCCQTTVALK